ncbi:MAG: cytochrome c biogenesis protein ResB [Micromonosporaceae bacterium]|nr:cytochrome c biogenesis protein ResB [Micromonosporaceae bacterium]
MSTVEQLGQVAPPQPPSPPRTGPGRAVRHRGRRFWRWLTSMRTALLLLFLLAIAAIPGSLLPQRNLSPQKVSQYFIAHPALAPWLDRVSAFNVYSSPWFSAIYLLLFVSLVGCVVPRLRAHAGALVRVPPDAPARLDRMPAHAGGIELHGAVAEVAARGQVLLKKHHFRVRTRTQPDGSVTLSAEKGYLKETGNLLFHFSLIAVLLGVALGSWYGYHGDRIVVTGADQGFCNTLQQYDDYGLGARVDPAALEPFCLQLDRFQANYSATGQPTSFAAGVSYTVEGGGSGRFTIRPNEPLRLSRARVYLLGHGYAPVIRYTDRYGHSQTSVVPFLTDDAMLTGHGVAQFPDVNIPPTGRDPNNKQQMAFVGFYTPTSDGHDATSVWPGERNPVLTVTPYRGDLGLDAGIPTSVYTLDQDEVDRGRLVPVTKQPVRLRPGQSYTLDDGSRVEFLGTRQWAGLQVRYDPGEPVVLVGAVCLLLGLVTMLLGRRRRVWLRIRAAGTGDSTVEAGALARGEHSGLREELDALLARLRDKGAD